MTTVIALNRDGREFKVRTSMPELLILVALRARYPFAVISK
jgi:hypothetical protein